MNVIKQAVCAVAAAGVLALAACGQTTPEGGENDPSQGKGQGAGGDTSAVQVKDALGTVTLDAPATKVVALEWSYIENLLALGVTPVGVTDKKGYEQWVTAGPRLAESIEDVGLRQEPSLESIRALQPDLIIAEKQRDAQIADDLKDIAPTVFFDPTRTDMSQWEEMRETFTQMAKATGKSAQAEKVLASLDAKIAEGKATLEKAGKSGAPVALAQGFTAEGAPSIRMFTNKAMAGQILEKLGLKNAWTGEPDPWGFTTVDVEALTSVSKADFLYVAEPKDDIFTGALAKNAVWRGLDFVRTDRVHALDPGTWFFGGPLSSEQIVDEVVGALS